MPLIFPNRAALRAAGALLLLSPALQAASQQYGTQAVVWGTYAVTQRTLYVSLKIFHALDGTVLAASDYALPVDDDVRRLLAAR